MGTSVEEEYMYMLEMSWGHPVEQVNHVIFKNRKVDTDMNGRHTRVNHEYWEGRLGEGCCPYCRHGGVII